MAGQWITETQARKLTADARLRAATGTRPSPARMTKEQIAATVTTIRDLVRALRTAATEDKAEIYAGLNLQLTYQPQERIVNTRAEAACSLFDPLPGLLWLDGRYELAASSAGLR